MIAGAITSQTTTTGRQPQRRLININANGVRYTERRRDRGERGVQSRRRTTMTITYRILVCRVLCSTGAGVINETALPAPIKWKFPCGHTNGMNNFISSRQTVPQRQRESEREGEKVRGEVKRRKSRQCTSFGYNSAQLCSTRPSSGSSVAYIISGKAMGQAGKAAV